MHPTAGRRQCQTTICCPPVLPRTKCKRVSGMRKTIAELAHPVWEGEKDSLTLPDVEAALPAAGLPETLKRRLTALLADWRAVET